MADEELSDVEEDPESHELTLQICEAIQARAAHRQELNSQPVPAAMAEVKRRYRVVRLAEMDAPDDLPVALERLAEACLTAIEVLKPSNE